MNKEIIHLLEKECLKSIENCGKPNKRVPGGYCGICFHFDQDRAEGIKKNMTCKYVGWMKALLPEETCFEQLIITVECEYRKHEKEKRNS